MEDRISAKDLDLLKSTLSQDRNVYISWIQRKEIAVWSAVVFYLAGLWTLFSFILKYEKPITVTAAWLVLISLLILFRIIFAFVHSQFSSIYFSRAYELALQTIFFKLIAKRADITLDLNYEEGQNHPNLIKKELERQLKTVQRFRGKKHPFQILRYFWTDFLRGKEKKITLGNHEKQEAATYSLFIFMNAILALYLMSKIIG